MKEDEAITGCMKQWEYYAETGTKSKQSYSPAKPLRCQCFFCQYKDVDLLCGEGCPGYGYWADGSRGSKQGHCLDNGAEKDKQTSLFKYWEGAKTKKERKLWASRIVWMVWLIQQDRLKAPGGGGN